MRITRIKQSCFVIKWKDITIVIDPYGIKDQMDGKIADIILVTHSHFDHYEGKSIKRAASNESTLVFPKSVKKIGKKWKNSMNIVGIEPKKKVEVRGLTIEGFPMYNIHKLIKFHKKKKRFCGYLVSDGSRTIYHAGDTDRIPEMKYLKQENVDIAFLPIGGYFTMNPEQAINAAQDISPKTVVPMHNRLKDLKVFEKTFKGENEDIELKCLDEGEATQI